MNYFPEQLKDFCTDKLFGKEKKIMKNQVITKIKP